MYVLDTIIQSSLYNNILCSAGAQGCSGGVRRGRVRSGTRRSNKGREHRTFAGLWVKGI